MQLMYRLIFFILFLGYCVIPSFAYEGGISTVAPSNYQSIELKNSIFHKNFNNAIEKFEKLNIESSHSDFINLIEQNSGNDYYLLLLGDKTAELGFFDLSNLAFSKIKDVDISSKNIEETKKMYYPKKNICKSDLIVLSEIYSNLKFNDSADVAVSELKDNTRLLKEYDYANYVLALGYYYSKNPDAAKKYINEAVKLNPDNISYKLMKSLIFSNIKNGKISKKIISEISSNKIYTLKYQDKINSANEYLNYILATNENTKNYYLGRYYFVSNDYSKAIRNLQGAIGKDKKLNSNVYAYLSRCYYAQNDYEKSTEMVQKCAKIDSHNTYILITQADLALKDGDYKTALKYYKSAGNKLEALEKLAIVYSSMGESKKSNEVIDEIITKYDNSFIAYYKKSRFDNELINLKKSIAININYVDAWIDLARVMLDSGRYNLARNYLESANYIDNSNSFRYYYYYNILNQKEIELQKNTTKKDKVLNRVANEI